MEDSQHKIKAGNMSTQEPVKGPQFAAVGYDTVVGNGDLDGMAGANALAYDHIVGGLASLDYVKAKIQDFGTFRDAENLAGCTKYIGGPLDQVSKFVDDTGVVIGYSFSTMSIGGPNGVNRTYTETLLSGGKVVSRWQRETPEGTEDGEISTDDPAVQQRELAFAGQSLERILRPRPVETAQRRSKVVTFLQRMGLSR